jgi:hypothetical protein
MTTLPRRRPLVPLLTAALIAVFSLASPARAETPTDTPSRVDLADVDTGPLGADLTALLAAAEYRRDADEPDAPSNRITSLDHALDALRTHRGLAYVLVAARGADGERVTPRTLYVLQGDAPAAGGPAAPPSAAQQGRSAVLVDLSGAEGQALLESLQGHVQTLLSAAARTPVQPDEVLDALRQPVQVAYAVLVAGAGDAAESRVLVVPDVLRISIRDDAWANAPAAGAGLGDAASPQQGVTVELVPHPDGGPPMIKFEFDPSQFIKEGQ